MFDLRSQHPRSRALALSLLAAGALFALSAGVVAAQSVDEELSALRVEIAETFSALPLSEGWLLQPLDEDAGFQSLQIDGSTLAIDGVEISADELRARLGDLAAPVLQLNGLGSDELVSILGDLEIDTDAPDVASEAAEAEGEEDGKKEVHRSDAQVVVGSSVTIEEDEVARDVAVIGGSLTVHGVVKGDAVAIGGSVDVNGRVTGDVAAIGSSLSLGPEAHVSGDAVAIGGNVHEAEGSVVEGMVQEVPFFPSLHFGGWGGDGAKIMHRSHDVDIDFSPAHTVFSFGWELFGIAVLIGFAFLTLLIAKNPVERVGRQVQAEPWKSGLVGLLSQILFFPLLVILILILVISIVGIPFLLLLPFAILALVLVALLGYTAVALTIGRWSEERFGWNFSSPFLVLLVGIGLIEIWSLIGEILAAGPGPIKFFAVMFGLFGGLLCYAVVTIGFGAAILSRAGTSPGWDGNSEAMVAAADWNVPLEPDIGSDIGAADTSAADDVGGWINEDQPAGDADKS